jgi:O-Antigen ligase
MLMTSTRPASRPAPGLPPPSVRPDRSDRLPRWTVALAIAGLPLLIPPGPSNTAPADVFIVIAIGATLLWAASTRQLVKFPYVVGIGTMVVAGCVAAVFGKYPHTGALALLIDLFLLGWGTTVANVGRTDAAARFLMRVWCVTGSLWSVGLLAFVGHHAASSGTATAEAARASFTLGEQNGAGFYFAVTILMILAGRYPRRLWLRVPVLACLLLDTLLTGSLAAISGLAAGLALALIVRTAARHGGAAALVLFLVLAVVAAGGQRLEHHYQVVPKAQSSQNLLLRNSIGRAQQSIWERQTITDETLHLWRTSTLLGLGPNATKSTLKQEQAPYPKEAHDDWTAALVERGIVGFAGMLLLVGEIIWRASRVGSPRRLGPGLAAGLPAPEFLVGALATMAVYSFTHQILHDRTAWTLLGILAAFSLWRMQARWPGPDATSPVASRGTR